MQKPCHFELTPQQRYDYLTTLLLTLNSLSLPLKKAKFKTPELKETYETLLRYDQYMKTLPMQHSSEQNQQAHTAYLMDQLLAILNENTPHIGPVPIYALLMQCLQFQKNYIDAHQIALFLIHKKKHTSYRLIDFLMEYANKQHRPQQALDYFNAHYTNLDEKSPRDLLHLHVMRSYQLLERHDIALELCQKKLIEKYHIYYHAHSAEFKQQGRIITAQDEHLKNPQIYDFCLALANIIRPQNIQKTITILTLLREANSENISTVMMLASAYKQTNQIEESIAVYHRYLQEHPGNVIVFTNYIHLLLDTRHLDEAREMIDVFIQQYQGHQHAVKKIQILQAWYHRDHVQGKREFTSLLTAFPHDRTIAYLTLRYAIKIRDKAWSQTIMQAIIITFPHDQDFLQNIRLLSEASILSAALDADYFYQSSNLLSDTPVSMIHAASCPTLPRIIQQSFEKFCTCETQPCQSTCLNDLYLTGEAAALLLRWSETNQAHFLSHIKDLDFVKLVPQIQAQYLPPTFHASPFILNLFTCPAYNDEPALDVRLYTMQPGLEHTPYDVSEMIKNRDLLHNMLLINTKGRVLDGTHGESIQAARLGYLKLYGNPLQTLQEDPVRVIRIISKLSEGLYQLEPSSAQALHDFEPIDWLKNERTRKKLTAMLTSPYALERIKLMRQFKLLGEALTLEASASDQAQLEHCLFMIIRTSQTETNSAEHTLWMRQLRDQASHLEQKLSYLQLKKDIHQIKLHLKCLREKNLKLDHAHLKQEAKKEKEAKHQENQEKQKIKKLRSTHQNTLLTHEETIAKITLDYDIQHRRLQKLERQRETYALTHDVSRHTIFAQSLEEDAPYEEFSRFFHKIITPITLKSAIYESIPYHLWSKNAWQIIDINTDVSPLISSSLWTAFIFLNLGCHYLTHNEAELGRLYLKMSTAYLNLEIPEWGFNSILNEIEPIIHDITYHSPYFKESFSHLMRQLKIKNQKNPTAETPHDLMILAEYAAFKAHTLAEKAELLEFTIEKKIYNQNNMYLKQFLLIYDYLNDVEVPPSTLQKKITRYLNDGYETIRVHKKPTIEQFLFKMQHKNLRYHFDKKHGNASPTAPIDPAILYEFQNFNGDHAVHNVLACIYHLNLGEYYLCQAEKDILHVTKACGHYETLEQLIQKEIETAHDHEARLNQHGSHAYAKKPATLGSSPEQAQKIINHPLLGCFWIWARARLSYLNSFHEYKRPLTQEESVISILPLFQTALKKWSSDFEHDAEKQDTALNRSKV